MNEDYSEAKTVIGTEAETLILAEIEDVWSIL